MQIGPPEETLQETEVNRRENPKYMCKKANTERTRYIIEHQL